MDARKKLPACSIREPTHVPALRLSARCNCFSAAGRAIADRRETSLDALAHNFTLVKRTTGYRFCVRHGPILYDAFESEVSE
jgi:hypothetical protein